MQEPANIPTKDINAVVLAMDQLTLKHVLIEIKLLPTYQRVIVGHLEDLTLADANETVGTEDDLNAALEYVKYFTTITSGYLILLHHPIVYRRLIKVSERFSEKFPRMFSMNTHVILRNNADKYKMFEPTVPEIEAAIAGMFKLSLNKTVPQKIHRTLERII